MEPYDEFTLRFKLLVSKNPALVIKVLSNIFTMRLIGNKTHGDLAEIAISEFINQYMYDYKSIHVGKEMYRSKLNEEDIKVINEITRTEFPISLKAYGDGPLQLSTDKKFALFPKLATFGKEIKKQSQIQELWLDPVFEDFNRSNILPLIYDEKKQSCNILVFDRKRAQQETTLIQLEDSGKGRKHPVYKFYGFEGQYICEVRYGGGTANALQRGLWTHTKNALPYFNSLSSGWISYEHNMVLVELFSHALVASSKGHQNALELIKKDIEAIKSQVE